jgi:hypothetical protein
MPKRSIESCNDRISRNDPNRPLFVILLLDFHLAQHRHRQIIPEHLRFCQRLTPVLLCEQRSQLGAEMLERNVGLGVDLESDFVAVDRRRIGDGLWGTASGKVDACA